MSTTTEPMSNFEGTTSSPLFHNLESFNHVVTHVFFPPELPRENDYIVENDLSLANAVCAAAHAYTPYVCRTPEEDSWLRITKMLDNLRTSVQSGSLNKDHTISQLRGMGTGDIITFFVHPQNAAMIVTKRENSTLFELFEVSPSKDAVEKTPGSLVCSYPWSAVETSNKVFDDEDFQSELAHFLSLPGTVNSDLPCPPAQPEYITALLSGILQSVGRAVDVTAISKRIRDNVGQWPRHPNVYADQGGCHRRSTLWVLIRVAVQMSVERSSAGRAFYKRFMLYFICTLARDRNNANLSSDLLHLMSSKIFHRLSKFGPSAVNWLSKMALETCARLRETLDARWNKLSVRRSPFRNPSQEELVRDTVLSLPNSSEYIRSITSTPDTIRPRTPFDPNHRCRGTLKDFLSLDMASFDDADPEVTIYDVEQSVGQEIDDWIAHVAQVDDGCAQLDILMDWYSERAQKSGNPEHDSINILTMLELFIAIDKLAVQETPMLADYSPGIPVTWLEELCLRKTAGLHRLSCMYQYLVARESRSRPGWSAVSDEFTQDSFPVRYYDQSPHLQQLKARIEEEIKDTCGDTSPMGTLDYQEQTIQRLPAQDATISKSPLPTSSLHAKVVVFELQCPPYIRIWRSAIARIYCYIWGFHFNIIAPEKCRLLAEVSELQPYLVEHQGPSLSAHVRFLYFFPDGLQSRNPPTLRYLVHHSHAYIREQKDGLVPWQQPPGIFNIDKFYFVPSPPGFLRPYTGSTSHTSNSILAAQANCPADISLNCFITGAHLRSGPSLQWLNILLGLRSRTLDLRREEVLFLLAWATFQVGPLDPNTMTWIWHQELEDTSFCNALVDELDDLFTDGAGLIDGVFMGTISSLLTRILQVVSNPSVHVSERVIVLLRRVRKKTFSWVQELSYNLQMAPMNEERKNSLLHMALICRSTFDVDRITLPRLIHSAEDVDALLSCSFFIHALRPRRSTPESHKTFLLLLERDRRLTPTLEEIARDVVLSDPSNRGVDLAIARIFISYRPCAWRLEPLKYPSARWLTCHTKIQGQPSQTVHINLLDGQLRVNDQPFGRLPHEISHHKEYRLIFDSECFVVPSDIPGMDFMTLTATTNYRVHFLLRGEDLVIRAQCNQTNQVLQLIHPRILYKDLPPALIDDHIHWLDVSSGVIEIRPRRRCWEPSVENWRINCTSGSYHAYKGRDSLVDIRSPTGVMLSECFGWLTYTTVRHCSNLYQTRNILITTSTAGSVQSTSMEQLSIALPGHALSFFVNDREELESRDFKYMVYDEDQCIQTLFGLKYILVLRPTTRIAKFSIPEALISRIALVLDGQPDERKGFHFHGDHGSCYVFRVDPELGYLVGNGGLNSTRLLAYFHAMTSFHRPDPLLDKEGIQAACDFLRSAGCRSIMQGKALGEAMDFRAIPGDAWNSTRYPHFHAMLKEIRDRYYWDRCPYVNLKASWDLQGKRAARRAVHLYPSSGDRQTSQDVNEDFDYSVPNSNQELEVVASAASSAVHHWVTSTRTMDTILDWVKIWRANALFGPPTTSKPGPEIPVDSDPSLAQLLVSRVQDILEKRKEAHQQFPLLFLLPTLAYCSPSHQTTFLSMLAAFAPRTDDLLIPDDCKLSDGYRPTEQVIRNYVHTSRLEDEWNRNPEEYAAVDAAVNQLLSDWPSNSPPTILLDPRVWETEQLTASLRQLFLSCHRNRNLKEHLVRSLVGLPTLPRRVPPAQYTSSQHTPLQITLGQLLSGRPPPELPQRSTQPRDGLQAIDKTPGTWGDIPALDRLFSSLQTNSRFQEEYIALLSASKESLPTHRPVTKDNIDILQKYYTKCRTIYMDALGRLKNTLSPVTDRERVLEKFSRWPSITADALLRCLASTSPIHLSEQWEKCLVSFAQLLLELQRSRRLLRLALDGLEEEFSKELESEQCEGWNAEEYPDWLLIQVQGDFLIRRAQAETAMELMFPQSGGNTVMQVNMGEGKSSVIIPIVAAALADGKQLVRLIVPKALTTQMFDILVSRLGWLTNRPIYHLPFSRAAHDDPNDNLKIETLRKLMSQCMAERGILLVQPEHVVSLKLMCVEKQIDGGNTLGGPSPNLLKSVCQQIVTSPALITRFLSKDSLVGSMFRQLGQPPNCLTFGSTDNAAPDGATEWLSLHEWVHTHVRDILDESDEILHPRFQMIYTIGFEQHMDGYPDRWTITQQILRLMKDRAHTLSRNYPHSVEYECGPPGSFPHVHIARASGVGRRLISTVVEDIMAGRLPNFSFQKIPSAVLRGAIRGFISDKDVLQVSDTAKMVEEYAKHSHQSYLWNGLLLLRGLLASNILLFAFSEKRWRVDYGLFPRRRERSWDGSPVNPPTMLAVPFRAKDVPAPNTQFGHPDLTIILTCLSYYYTGLTEEQLRTSFEILLDLDDPAAEYSLWIRDYESLPESLRNLSDINPRSSEEWDNTTLPLFSKNQAVIDFYLSRVVFPKEAKEFPWKLCGSSWDLGEKREKLVTGFSGTSDGRWLLPMSVVQRDLHHQRGTSARVLAQLLEQEREKESQNYIVTHGNGERLTTEGFLKLVATQRPEIRVLLDVGAQILDLSNRQVADAWLCVVHDAEAAIYFDEDDELTVLPRNARSQPLSSSPFSQQLGKCVVYLDHPHTRGTDLKFPIGSRAAVTLGPKVTKDALVQGCMRMRKLGHGHSVMFFAPPGVDQSIRVVASKQDRDLHVIISDVLSWTIRETWADIEHRAPHWAQQGIDHQSRCHAFSSFCNTELARKQLSEVWLQPNYKSLADLYAPRETEDTESDLSAVPGMQQQCKVLGILSLPNGQLEEEQEREVHREREREREAELPPKAVPAEHHLHEDVVAFVRTGVIPPSHSDGAFLPVFTTLERSTAATRDADVWSPSILATADFSRTIKPESTKGTTDQYLRPVQWILSGKTDRGPVLVILSPFEADLLIPDIRTSKHVHLHLYAPRTAERMKPSDDLRLYAIPPLPSDWTPPWELIDQLNVFAGQLYLSNYQSYLRLSGFLDVPTKELPSNRRKFQWNLLQMPGSFEEMSITFSDSPLPMVMALLAIRNRGRPFDHTHMGKILQGRILTQKDFEPKSVMPDRNLPPPLDLEGVQSGPGLSVLPRPPKRGLETDESSESAAEDSEPLQKRARATTNVIVPFPSLPSDAHDQPEFSQMSKRALEIAETCDANQEPTRKRPRVD